MDITVVTGIDLVYLPRFKKALAGGGQTFLKRVFHEEELKNQDTNHLAGIFAAKEAVIKALRLPIDSWHDIVIEYNKDGSPKIKILYPIPYTLYPSLSISHDGDYVVASFVARVKQ